MRRRSCPPRSTAQNTGVLSGVDLLITSMAIFRQLSRFTCVFSPGLYDPVNWDYAWCGIFGGWRGTYVAALRMGGPFWFGLGPVPHYSRAAGDSTLCARRQQ